MQRYRQPWLPIIQALGVVLYRIHAKAFAWMAPPETLLAYPVGTMPSRNKVIVFVISYPTYARPNSLPMPRNAYLFFRIFLLSFCVDLCVTQLYPLSRPPPPKVRSPQARTSAHRLLLSQCFALSEVSRCGRKDDRECWLCTST